MKKNKKPKPRSKPDPLRQIAKYIESQGWRVVVIGPARIQQPLGSREFQFEFVVNFVGSKREGAR